ncbi:MAG TPA: hypothetical protein ENG45_00540 [Candidatus Aenigmarchaeota archaeon]|nr:hypothetical protein [Candidatus Aenigmarchaeota archaeon]
MSDLIAVRGVEKEVFRKFKAKSVEEGLKLGEALTLAMKEWLKEREKEKVNVKNLAHLAGVIKLKKRVRWSSEVDRILYGE